MVVWKDASSYSRSDSVREPSCWEAKTKSMRISVHRHIHYPPDVWMLSVHDLGIDKMELSSKDTDDAKKEAISIVEARLRKMLSKVDK